MVVAAYGLILPQSVLDIPKYGCINLHPSLLPKYRGALPVQQTILNGDDVTGMTIMQMEKGLDSGPILLQRKVTLNHLETADVLLHHMAELGAVMLEEILTKLDQNELCPHVQAHDNASYTQNLLKKWDVSIGQSPRCNWIVKYVRLILGQCLTLNVTSKIFAYGKQQLNLKIFKHNPEPLSEPVLKALILLQVMTCYQYKNYSFLEKKISQ